MFRTDLEITADGLSDEDILISLSEPIIEGSNLTPAGEIRGKQRRLTWCTKLNAMRQIDIL